MRRIISIAWIVCLLLFVVHSAGAADAAKPSSDKAKAAKTEKSAAAKAKDTQPKTAAAAAKKDQPAKKQAVKEKKKETAKTARLVRMTIKGDYPEGPTSAGLFGDLKPSLRVIIERIDQAAEDSDVDAVVLSIEDLAIGQGKIQELRGAIARFHKHGKPIYAELTSADTRQFVLAMACDEVFMPASGMLILPGLRGDDLLQGPLRQAGDPLRHAPGGEV